MSESISTVPPEIKKLVEPFIKRGKELSNLQPLISYYCYLYAAQLIIQSKTHMESESVAIYIETLLNTIEDSKKTIESSSEKLNEVLVDKEKSFKLVLNFSLKIFNKSVDEISKHLSSKETVLGFMAFLNFIEILNLWPEFKQGYDLKSQVKYAKFHSNRILKDLKAGLDPNDYVTQEDENELSDMINEEKLEDQETTKETDISLGGDVALPQPPTKIQGEMNLPTPPVLIKGLKNDLGLPTAPSESSFTSSLEASSPSPSFPPVTNSAPSLPPKPAAPEKPKIKTPPVRSINKPSEALDESKVLSREDVEQIWKKEEIISNAQKKAKYAISALNYEDIETAIIELQEALDLLRGK